MPAREGPYATPAAEILLDSVMAAAIRKKPKATVAEIRLTDGSWSPCKIIAWARNQRGWAVLVNWPGRVGEMWLQYSPGLIRPGSGGR